MTRTNTIWNIVLLTSTVSLGIAACAVTQTDTHESPPVGDLLIENVRTITFEGNEPDIRDGMRVLISGDRIVFAGNTEQELRADEIIDGRGLTLLPGLTDMHVHIWDEAELGAYLAHGVTTVRNMSGMPFHLDMADRIQSGELFGPRLLTTGPILNSSGPNQQINHQIVEDADAARTAVRWQYDQGFRELKIYSNLTPEAYDAIREEAARLGMSITGHSPEGRRSSGIPLERDFEIPFDDLLDDDFLTLEHVESIVWHGLRSFHDEVGARSLARDIANAGIPVTPTLLAHHNLYRVASEGERVLTRPGTEWLNPFVQATEAENHQRWLHTPPLSVGRDDEFYQRVTGIFQEEDVLLLAGTDAGIFTNIPGLSLIEELELLVDAGLSPFEAIQTATSNVATVLDEEDRACITAGCAADLVLYACDPLQNVRCMEQPQAVIRQGKHFDRQALDTLLETSALTNVERSQSNLLNGLAAQGTPLNASASGD